MRDIHLTEIGTSPDHDREYLGLLYELQDLQTPRPYQTTVQTYGNPGCRFVLSTTSKDLHLSLGRLGSFSQGQFCRLLEATYKEGKDPQMSFSFDPKKDQSKARTIFVARTEGHDLTGPFVTFNLSPGH